MLKKLVLENFKAFGQSTTIDLSPITLVFGENSAGKSSILHSLNLLKQTREGREAGATLLPRAEFGTVDLGSFQELLFDHDLTKPLKILLGFDISSFKNAPLGRFRRLVSKFSIDSVGIELTFQRPSLDEEVQLSNLAIYFGDPYMKVAEFEQLKKIPKIGPEILYYIRRERKVSNQKLRAMSCSWVTKDSKVWKPAFEIAKQHASVIIHGLKRLENEHRNMPGKNQESLFQESISKDDSQLYDLDSIQNAIRFFSSDFTIDEFIDRMASTQLNNTMFMDGFIPTNVPRKQESMVPEEEAFFRSGPLSRFDGITFDACGITVSLGSLIEHFLSSLFPLGPFRRPPERWYIFTGTSPEDVGFSGNLLPDLLFRNPSLVNEANNWLEKLDIGYQLKVKSLGSQARDLFEVRLLDTKRESSVEVSLSDVGFGISQLLPFIVQSLASKEQLISIEQPEVHIHPRLQADIGDLLSLAIQEPRLNRFLIETHSEHLILRILKLIRKKELSPNDVSVIYVSKGKSGAIAKNLRIDEDGYFIDQWPGGFFPERLNEVD